MKSKSLVALPRPVANGLRQLGQDIRQARVRRRMTVQAMAERAFTSPATIGKIERGSASVSLGIYASVLFVLGLHEKLATLAAPGRDTVGMALYEAQLPKRVRASKKRPF